jgi:hypothetical protein
MKIVCIDTRLKCAKLLKSGLFDVSKEIILVTGEAVALRELILPPAAVILRSAPSARVSKDGWGMRPILRDAAKWPLLRMTLRPWRVSSPASPL